MEKILSYQKNKSRRFPIITIAFFLLTTHLSFSSLAQNNSANIDNKYPQFSWDKMPLYMHIRKNTAFTPSEIKYLAQFPLITFEKTTGSKTYGSTEDGIIEAAKAVKNINSESKILYYKNVVINWETYKEDEAFINENPNVLLKNNEGNLVFMPNKRTPFFDLSQELVRNYWLSHVSGILNNSAIDGLFLDANIKVLVPGFFAKSVGKQKQKEIEKGYIAMMGTLNKKVAGNKLLIGNIIRVRPEFTNSGLEYLNFFDGSYIEGFDKPDFGMSYQDYLAKGIEATQKAAKEGKIIAMSLGIGEAAENETAGMDDRRNVLEKSDDLTKRIDYLLAIFLVCAEKYSYILPHDGYNAITSDIFMKSFPQYKKKLGPPKGSAERTGYIYKRSFKYLDVTLDLQHKTAKLDWKH